MNKLSIARLTFAMAAPFALIAAACGGDDGDEGASSFSFSLEALEDSGVTGSADLSQDGDTVTGTIELSGFEPNTAHAMHLHGEEGVEAGCAEDERTTNHLITFPDLEADADGNVNAELNIKAPEDAVRSGTYVMVHALADGETLEAEDDAMAMEEDMDMAEDDAMEEEAVEDDGHSHTHGTNPGVTCGEASA